MSASLFLKDPGSARYVAGGLAEAEELFGSPLPDLPAPEIDEGREVFLVHVHSRLRAAAAALPRGPARADRRAHRSAPATPRRDFAEYEAALVRVRRLGAAGRPPAGPAQPVLAGAQPRRGGAPARRSSSAASRCARASSRCTPCCSPSTGASTRTAAGAARARTAIAVGREPVARGLDHRRRLRLHRDERRRARPRPLPGLEQALPHRPRGVLRDPADPGARGGAAAARGRPRAARPRGAAPAAAAPRALPEARQPGADRAQRAGAGLPAGRPLDDGPAAPGLARDQGARSSAGAARRCSTPSWTSSVALRRFELVSHLRDRVESLGAERSLELEEKTRLGLRVYEFGESAEVLNNAVAATVLFLDLRGFTRTSEGQISERRPDPRALRASSTTSSPSSSASAARWTSTSATA